MNGVSDSRDRRGFVPADSVLAVTAREIIAAHQPGPDTGATAVCRRCGAVAPCATARAATQVVAATGAPVAPHGTDPTPRGYAVAPRAVEPPPPPVLPLRDTGPLDARGAPMRIAAAS